MCSLFLRFTKVSLWLRRRGVGDLEVQNQQFVIFGTDCYGIFMGVGLEWFLKAIKKAKIYDIDAV